MKTNVCDTVRDRFGGPSQAHPLALEVPRGFLGLETKFRKRRRSKLRESRENPCCVMLEGVFHVEHPPIPIFRSISHSKTRNQTESHPKHLPSALPHPPARQPATPVLSARQLFAHITRRRKNSPRTVMATRAATHSHACLAGERAGQRSTTPLSANPSPLPICQHRGEEGETIRWSG